VTGKAGAPMEEVAEGAMQEGEERVEGALEKAAVSWEGRAEWMGGE